MNRLDKLKEDLALLEVWLEAADENNIADLDALLDMIDKLDTEIQFEYARHKAKFVLVKGGKAS